MKTIIFTAMMIMITIPSSYAVMICVQPPQNEMEARAMLTHWRNHPAGTMVGSHQNAPIGSTQWEVNGAAVAILPHPAGRGIVRGEAICSYSPGVANQVGIPEFYGTGANGCWCRLIEVHLLTGQIWRVAGPWVFPPGQQGTAGCFRYCAHACANHVQWTAGFRAAVFAIP